MRTMQRSRLPTGIAGGLPRLAAAARSLTCQKDGRRSESRRGRRCGRRRPCQGDTSVSPAPTVPAPCGKAPDVGERSKRRLVESRVQDLWPRALGFLGSCRAGVIASSALTSTCSSQRDRMQRHASSSSSRLQSPARAPRAGSCPVGGAATTPVPSAPAGVI